MMTLDPAAFGCTAVISPDLPIPCPNLEFKNVHFNNQKNYIVRATTDFLNTYNIFGIAYEVKTTYLF